MKVLLLLFLLLSIFMNSLVLNARALLVSSHIEQAGSLRTFKTAHLAKEPPAPASLSYPTRAKPDAPVLPTTTTSILTAEIHAGLPVYEFLLVPRRGLSRKHIIVFRGVTTTKPIQTIRLAPELRDEEEARILDIHDVNFDGYSDVGVLVAHGALWTARQYWLFHKDTGTFIRAPGTIVSGEDLEFATTTKEIIARGLLGAIGSYKRIYQYMRGRLQVLEESEAVNAAPPHRDRHSARFRAYCRVTTRDRRGSVVSTSVRAFDEACAPLE